MFYADLPTHYKVMAHDGLEDEEIDWGLCDYSID